MKKIILSIAILLFSAPVFACDICGCGVGSYYLGILPDFHKRFFGLRYQHKSLLTHLGSNGEATYLTTKETYSIAELWGGWNIGTKFRVLAFAPVNFNTRENQGHITHKSGVGDLAFMGYANIFTRHRGTAKGKMLAHSLWAGLGIKIPTGAYSNTDKNVAEGIQNTFQLGTGSVDYTFQAAYDIRLQDAGINTNINYKWNSANRYEYRYGNKFTLNTLAYYKFRVHNSISVAPNAGLLYEQAAKDVKQQGITVDISGGHSLAIAGGCEINFKKMSVGAGWQHPVQQRLANGSVSANDRIFVHVSCNF